jgi:hypothetical protein
MINFGGSLNSLLGILLILGSGGYLIMSMEQTREATRLNQADDIAPRLLQTFLGPVLLLASGLILLIQGWRLDPLLLLQNLLMSMLVGYLILADWRRFNRMRQR